MRKADECSKMSVEVNDEGQVLLVFALRDGDAPAIVGFSWGDAERLGKVLKEASLDARILTQSKHPKIGASHG